jgi:hypothetical protein
VEFQLPDPNLTPLYRLEASLGEPLELGRSGEGRRRIAPLIDGRFSGPELSGTLVPGASADWQTVLPDGTALDDTRYMLRTDGGEIVYVQSRRVRRRDTRHAGKRARGQRERTYRAATKIDTTAATLDWLNEGVFISVASREAERVIYETYLVG